MYNNKTATALMLGFALAVFGFAGSQAEAQVNSPSENTQRLVKRLETNMSRFDQSLDTALDRSRLNGTDIEDQINPQVDELKYATDRLEDRVDDGPIASDVVDVLGSAFRVETFMQKNRLSPTAERDWAQVKTVLDELARTYNVAWVWTVKNAVPLAKSEKRRVVNQLESRADEFRDSFDDALDKSRVDGKPYEDHLNQVVATFERTLDDLDSRVSRSEEMTEKDVLVVLNNARAIDDNMRKYKMTMRARRDWARVKIYLDDLARINNVAWVWVDKPGSSAITATDANTPK